MRPEDEVIAALERLAEGKLTEAALVTTYRAYRGMEEVRIEIHDRGRRASGRGADTVRIQRKDERVEQPGQRRRRRDEAEREAPPCGRIGPFDHACVIAAHGMDVNRAP